MYDVSLIEHFTYIGICCILILGGFGFPVPEDSVLIITGLLIAQDVIALLPSILIIYPSVLISDFILYSIGRKYGKNIVHHKKFSVIISAPTLAKFEQKFNRWGVLMIVAGRHVAGLRTPIFLISGIVGVRRLKFLLVDAISAVFSISGMLALGYFAGNSLLVLKRNMARVDHIVIVAIAAIIMGSILIGYYKYRKREKKLSEKEEG